MLNKLIKLKLHNFRSYAAKEISFPENLTVIHGANGAGKTNLLEAISFLSPGRGLRGARLDEIAHFGRNEWSVIGELGGYKITTGLESGRVQRLVKIDDQLQRGSNILAEYVSCIWLTPQMDGIFLESSSERRRFFDRIIYNFDPEHASRVAVYENAMRERLRLLKMGSHDRTWLKVLEQRMAEYGIAIAAARNEVIGYLQESLGQAQGTFPKPLIEIRGGYEQLLHHAKALEVEDRFVHDLSENRYDDAASGRTASGVHKTDFFVTNINKNMPASVSSTGEQKALLLSIILGLARLLRTRKNKTPVVLLDEVIAHLDAARREELFAEIIALGCQTFMTGTEKQVFEMLRVDAQFIQP